MKMAVSQVNGTKEPKTSWQEPLSVDSMRQGDRNVLGLNGRSIATDHNPQNYTIAPTPDAQANPIITWPAPDPITYKDALTTTQLNATTSVAGTLVYTPGPGYVLPAGTHTLWVTFIPADSNGDAPIHTSIPIVVDKATPAISWPTPAAITNGIALSDLQLNANASVPGTFVYVPAPGEVLAPGAHTLSVTFTPTDTVNYSTSQATVSLIVAEDKPVIAWPNPEPITYGTLLSASQLCASSFAPGIFEYKPRLGALLAAGEHQLSAAFTPEDKLTHFASRAAVSLTVARTTPAVQWPVPELIPYSTALGPTQLNATATVPGSFAYTPAAGELLAPGVHNLLLIFTPTDTLNYTTVRAVVPLTVTETFPSIIDWPIPRAISYGTALSATQLNAIASVPGTFVYTPAAGHILAPGRYTLSVSFTPTDNERYTSAYTSVVLEVQRPAETASSPFANGSTPSNSGPQEITSKRFTETKLRETRTYKGAVYEKGDDHQWHLQQK